MKKILIFLFFLISSINIFSANWIEYEELVQNVDSLHPGDVIIYHKRFDTVFGVNGHSSIVNSKKKIVDYKRIGYGYFESPIYLIEHPHRKVKVLRYKYMDEEFLNELEKNIWEQSDRIYGVFSDSYDSLETYCSKFIIDVFDKTAKKINKPMDLDKFDTLIVLPYDLFESDCFEEVEMKEER